MNRDDQWEMAVFSSFLWIADLSMISSSPNSPIQSDILHFVKYGCQEIVSRNPVALSIIFPPLIQAKIFTLLSLQTPQNISQFTLTLLSPKTFQALFDESFFKSLLNSKAAFNFEIRNVVSDKETRLLLFFAIASHLQKCHTIPFAPKLLETERSLLSQT
jgi:hypothetical protein